MQLSPEGSPLMPSPEPNPVSGAVPAIPSSALTPEQAQYAGQLHLIPAICTAVGAGLIGLIVLIVMWSSRKNESEFIRAHGKEAMNFHISLVLLSMGITLVSLAIFVPIMVISAAAGGKPGPEMVFAPFLLMCALLPISIGLILVALICGIKAYGAACKGEWYQYRYIVRFVK